MVLATIFLGSVIFAVLAWGDTYKCFEFAAEEIRTVKAYALCHLRYGHLGTQQQLSGGIDPGHGDHRKNGLAYVFFKGGA